MRTSPSRPATEKPSPSPPGPANRSMIPKSLLMPACSCFFRNPQVQINIAERTLLAAKFCKSSTIGIHSRYGHTRIHCQTGEGKSTSAFWPSGGRPPQLFPNSTWSESEASQTDNFLVSVPICSGRRSAHSQTVATRHPLSSKASRAAVSRFTLSENFFRQNSVLVAGVVL